MHAENFNVAICEENAEFLNFKPGGTRINHRKGLMQPCDTGCKLYVVILTVSRIKHENRAHDYLITRPFSLNARETSAVITNLTSSEAV
jgi:hypothetical protein